METVIAVILKQLSLGSFCWPLDFSLEREFEEVVKVLGAIAPREGDTMNILALRLTKRIMSNDAKAIQEIEEFIEDWHWDDRSHKYAQELCRFLFQFLDSLKQQHLTEKTIRKHTSNCSLIGAFECGYGYRDGFSPGVVFSSPEANYEYEFNRKVSDSKYAMDSYRSTWRKIHNYTKQLGLTD
ncbi:hypothetical protein IQ254_07550 [Nodosilinea sp. LEGE 07088]|uniref:hypothetical protein n=1 Tax=Nodosilinea sp. LEGE 07088 TaxID=2777968 RepID=UPI00187FCA0E|nr:hypothetical protein [Nodosilinea sp. LEGE 07088]MBE9137056.1 hypothetical protein [Nodosilinea sp. LEGE 07088]